MIRWLDRYSIFFQRNQSVINEFKVTYTVTKILISLTDLFISTFWLSPHLFEASVFWVRTFNPLMAHVPVLQKSASWYATADQLFDLFNSGTSANELLHEPKLNTPFEITSSCVLLYWNCFVWQLLMQRSLGWYDIT